MYDSLCLIFRMDSVVLFLVSPSVWIVALLKMTFLHPDTADSLNSESK